MLSRGESQEAGGRVPAGLCAPGAPAGCRTGHPSGPASDVGDDGYTYVFVDEQQLPPRITIMAKIGAKNKQI
jgi:hypothetical protein